MKKLILIFSALILFSNFTFFEEGNFSYEIFKDLLKKNVKNGLVNYEGFQTAEFDKYLTSLAKADLADWSRNASLAFWLNAYNACAIKNVLSHPGITNPQKVDGFFTKYKFNVAGKSLTLDQIENEMIRAKFKEPLIHFGVVCAARGCPKLQYSVFEAATVIEQLKNNAKKYLATDKGLILDKKNKIIHLSQIFNWFNQDFTKNNSLLDFILPYLNSDSASFIKKNKNEIKIKFIEYDWTLNSSEIK